MSDRKFNVLFLCTGNSARSIIAECCLQRWGIGKFNSFSAGSQPKGQVHPMTIRILQKMNFKTEELRSKNCDEFAQPGAPQMDFVFTVCDNAASEICPVWPGQPMTAHWGVEDPAAFVGSDEEAESAFRRIYTFLDNRIKIFVSLPVASLDRLSLQKRLDEIGKTRDEPPSAA